MSRLASSGNVTGFIVDPRRAVVAAMLLATFVPSTLAQKSVDYGDPVVAASSVAHLHPCRHQ